MTEAYSHILPLTVYVFLQGGGVVGGDRVVYAVVLWVRVLVGSRGFSVSCGAPRGTPVTSEEASEVLLLSM